MEKYELLKAQRDFLRVPHKYNLDVALYQGGYGSGKTFAGSLLGVLLCLKYPKIRGLVGAQTFPIVRDTTLEGYFEHLENFNFKEGEDYKYLKSQARLEFKNGSQVLFRYFENPSKLKSLNLGFVEIEEMSDVPESTFKMLLGRLRQSPQPFWQSFKYRLFGHTNPEETRGWIYKNFVESQKPNYRLIVAPTTQNSFLPEGFVDELKKAYDKEYFRINVLGEFGEYTKGLVIKDFSAQNVRNINYDKYLDLHITCDFNVDPMCWILAHKTDEKVFFFDEIVLENTTTIKACEVFYERYNQHMGRIIINGDASGDYRSCTSEYTNYVLMRKRLSELGFKDVKVEIRPFNPPIKSRIAAFNCRLKNSKGEVFIYIDPKCEKLVYNLENLSYKEGTSQIDAPSHYQIRNDKKLKFLVHPFDAASYLVEYYFAQSL